ncbi:hypothetical protein LA080_006792 [Diaporthe eres]|nr:hypothetical protein LA080_006792 [Diaporthe eres]
MPSGSRPAKVKGGYTEMHNNLNEAGIVVTHLADGARLTDIHEMLAEASIYREDNTGCLEEHESRTTEQNIVKMMERAPFSQTDYVFCD